MEAWMIEDLERLRKEQEPEWEQEELVIPYQEYWIGGPEYQPEHDSPCYEVFARFRIRLANLRAKYSGDRKPPE